MTGRLPSVVLPFEDIVDVQAYCLCVWPVKMAATLGLVFSTFAGRVQLDVLDQDHLIVPDVEHGIENFLWVLVQTREHLVVGPGNPHRGLFQALAIRVLPQRDEQITDCGGGPIKVDRTTSV
jgi:hypothetical protein